MSEKNCSIEGCSNKAITKGYCSKHYARFHKYGDPYFIKFNREEEKHGMSRTPEYRTWHGTKDRCYNKNLKGYHRYGGRGIIVCDRWKNSFVNFYADMGDKPFTKAQLDRIDNDKGYYKKNCRWVTSAINNQNKCTTKLSMKIAKNIRKEYLEINTSQRKLAKKYNVGYHLIHLILHNKIWKELK